jgi:hypothetical protein
MRPHIEGYLIAGRGEKRMDDSRCEARAASGGDLSEGSLFNINIRMPITR